MTWLDWLLLTWWLLPFAYFRAEDHYGWGLEHNDGDVCGG